MKNLVIVESPTKAKTISKFLSKDFKIESSFGHVRDLPASKLGVDVDHDFEPTYTIPAKAKKRVKELSALAKKADLIYFATDEDREGEAISWHLAQIFKTPIAKTKRITFHEITEEAIKEALKNPRAIDIDMVDSQQARRILDRLVGYKLSPFLWKKVARGLSAGRVQSVVVRLLVEKEREIQDFKIEEYWEITGDFKTEKNEDFTAKLQKVNGKTLDKMAITSDQEANKLTQELETQKYYISDISKKEVKRNPNAPFTTSTLQQEANHRLNFSAKQTMMIAQKLYEGIDINGESIGLITYMRTDSTNLSTKFTSEAADYINDELGREYLNTKKFKTKSKGAQEAHEAIRPTSAAMYPESIKKSLNDQQFKLYQLIWQRAVASQMASAKLEATSVDINTQDDKYTFRVSGQVIKFDGFLKIYPTATKDEILPEMAKDEKAELIAIKPAQKFTQPPARYSDASLVKILEEKGIGRPSTYAPTIATVIERGYAERIDNRRLKPTEMAFVVNDLLVKHFSEIVDYDFTAKMENDFDDISEGKRKWQPVIKEFYEPFNKNLMQKEKELTKKEITEEKTDEKCEKCGSPMVIKVGRFGKFLACSNYPTCKNTKKILSNGQLEERPEPKKLDEKCPECGSNLVLRTGRYGEFKGCSNYPKCKYIKNEAAQDLNMKCPKCHDGDIVTKRSKKGLFYGCSNYPKCDFASWNKPLDKKCEKCGYPMSEDKNGNSKCTNRDCK
ncbi:MAG: type I DNA topoisomerase [Candidatus Buchananbacteria bacterium]|nr:type I DNA topoisomerase [Candidatus Buchananbacteria bacterium]